MLITIQNKTCQINNVNHYRGYGTVNTIRGKTIYVKGAPMLYGRKSIEGERGDDVSPGSKYEKFASLVRELLKCPDVSRWGAYLTGNFLLAILDEPVGECHIITDLGNSFHLFHGFSHDKKKVVFSTDIDALAAALGIFDNIDHVSIVDYLMHESITYPFTFYDGLREVEYASCTSCFYRRNNVPEMVVRQYWRPTCFQKEVSDKIDDLAVELREGLRNSCLDILNDKRNVGAFLSGGTDSRVIAGLLTELGIPCLGITVADAENAETRIAAEVAAANGLRHRLMLRDHEYYPRLIDASLSLEGPHFVFTRNMFLGFRDEIIQQDFDALIGGYMSDTLLKVHEANKVGRRFLGRDLCLWKFDETDYAYLRGGKEYIKRFSRIFHQDLLEQVGIRRRKWLEYWQELRTDGSAWEWSFMWPFTRNKHNSNLTTHIFNYQAFEIFTCRSVIEVARVASQKIKINGRLFNRATWPWVRKTRHIPISNTMVVPRSGLWGEFIVGLSHFLPRRWTLRTGYSGLSTDNVVATDRGWPDFYKLWEYSAVLKQLRIGYGKSGVASKFMTVANNRVFQAESYTELPQAIRYHIMYSLLFLDLWQNRISKASARTSLV